ncbi:hypothetical protein FT663_00500 [Candidozyma haemuli var. vulneris]|uniref:Dolichyl-phosphate-mannose--protein mannosyltransferase n=1 Tax=Candidozyma haemuli TaxID=45357 RepID=A0A2V1ASF3_9ASCO|nr:hypothetical protein CXQ85_002236 [[Candida] haemuloni]KAF3993477.1 hypothetical protein FT662_00606 [[Candida] haemuloni var. vulneris]KAF3995447.1 hypothetical protein FT663_00500 [[Candida] haemuloni var. vulneris]PVH20446.1 hypothetical protein CXQ85_002236 [[Candida] haemuloni]
MSSSPRDTFASGTDYHDVGSLRQRTQIPTSSTIASSEDLDSIIKQTSSLSIDGSNEKNKWTLSSTFVYIINPLLLTAVSAYLRLYGIGDVKKVIWDEAHFGKFGSHYLKNEFYFDVHPPLGKLLVGLSGWLAGYDGSFEFKSGNKFPEEFNIIAMRYFNCVFGILCTPFAYFTALSLGFSHYTVWYISLSVVFEMLSLTLSKFILLDSMLLFFTVTTFFGLSKTHQLNHENKLSTLPGGLWLAFTGVSIGCVCSVKWVGLFVTTLVGFYTIYDLLVRLYEVLEPQFRAQKRTSWLSYLKHWCVRIATLIIIPALIYIIAFKVHFMVLSKSGPGDGSISTLLQAQLEGNTLKNGPRSVAYGSLVTLRSQGLSPNLLHSHPHLYPEGSRQQQITTYGFKDTNNEFLIEFDLENAKKGRFATIDHDEDNPDVILDYKTLVKDGDTIRLLHKDRGCFLHSHSIAAPVSKGHYETSCYGNIDVNDSKDDWVIEIQSQDISPAPEFQNEDLSEVHPISTNFRLRHKVLGCYLATTGYSYPAWGFQQGEVTCKNVYLKNDKSAWWNFEDHVNNEFEAPKTKYVAPKPKFWKEFILLNYGMMASNNALIPDGDHYDQLASKWWEWPILRTGLRMSGWWTEDAKYFLMGNPFVTYFSTLSVGLSILLALGTLYFWQRQSVDLSVNSEEWNKFIGQFIFPITGYVLHYLPFILMGRVTYLHHYVPALYFAIFISGYVLETAVARKLPKSVTMVVYGLFYAGVIGTFWRFRFFSLGMVGASANYLHLKLLSSWRV